MSRPLRILISAGEESGDRLGAGLARALKSFRPGVDLIGMGGHHMREAGVRVVQDAAEVSVVGFVEVLRHLATIRRAMGTLERALVEESPDLVVPIDFPDFNLRLAARAARARIPVVYYVSPQVWAWRRGRVHAIRRLVRRMLVVLPFEAAFYEGQGVRATFVGHPAAAPRAKAPRASVRGQAGLDPRRPVVALLPGSRVGEVGRLFPILLDAAAVLRRTHPEIQCVTPRARGLPEGVLESIAARSPGGVTLLDGVYPEILEAADAAAVASGTATLETALAGLPFVAVYRMQAVSYWIARALVRVDHIALPNLVAGRRVVPELVQSECTPERIAGELAALLEDPARGETMRRAFEEIRTGLAGEGAFERAARAVLEEAPR